MISRQFPLTSKGRGLGLQGIDNYTIFLPPHLEISENPYFESDSVTSIPGSLSAVPMLSHKMFWRHSTQKHLASSRNEPRHWSPALFPTSSK